jgi:hypothetical protein
MVAQKPQRRKIGPLFHRATIGELNCWKPSTLHTVTEKSGEKATFWTKLHANWRGYDGINQRYVAETALPEPENVAESRTTSLICPIITWLNWVDAKIDEKCPPTVSRLSRYSFNGTPVSPVGVFKASNFHWLFSVAGGDTVLLAAGCPVLWHIPPIPERRN